VDNFQKAHFLFFSTLCHKIAMGFSVRILTSPSIEIKYMRKIQALFCLLLLVSSASAQVKSPKEFLGYSAGERFTPYHKMIDYIHHLKEFTPNSVLIQYGESYEHRPLMLYILSSNENITKLEGIRINNLNKAEGKASNPELDKIAIVWLSYNVHGNESVCMEAAIDAMYTFSSNGHPNSAEWLKNAVVIFGPCINPDGRDRYANFYNQYGNRIPNPDPQTRSTMNHGQEDVQITICLISIGIGLGRSSKRAKFA